ncbi:hypothetical protein HHK36_018126 [Tetracentron sinense]|uniref:Uncharacterized protein n=1 Tax=Tetracentron sinense TaxID=13715 RepID=A0A834Z1Q1_TETSI|nr:hypothetical protein HHK36_018126 [Tetracentron sinense]
MPTCTPSIVEFQPQCVRNHLVSGCNRIRTQGAQLLIKRPLPLILSSYPSNNHFSSSEICQWFLSHKLMDSPMLPIPTQVLLIVKGLGDTGYQDKHRQKRDWLH